MHSVLFEQNTEGKPTTWSRVRVRELVLADTTTSLGETYLENAIAAQPELICPPSSDPDHRVSGPFVPFTQVRLPAFSGGSIFPDLVVLCGSGDILVAEVKLYDNQDLRNRKVVSQVLEYAASLSTMDEHALLDCLLASEETTLRKRGEPPPDFSRGTTTSAGESGWEQFVRRHFGGHVPDPKALAVRFLGCLRRRRLQLVIVGDEVPRGTRELVEAVVGQEAIGEYRLRVVEIGTFVDPERRRVIFLPETSVETEIVQRTIVEIRAPNVSSLDVKVAVTSLREAEEATVSARERVARKGWNEASFFAATQDLPDGVRADLRTLYTLLQQECYELMFGTGAKIGTIRVFAGKSELLQLWTDGQLQVFFSVPFADDLHTRLANIGIELSPGQYRNIRPELWSTRIPELLRVLNDVRELLERAEG